MQPSHAEVLVGTVTVALACAAGAFAVRAGRRNWLWMIVATGCLLVVLGVVGQRSFPSADAVSRLGREVAARELPGPWDAGVGIPVIGVHVTPVTLVGLLLAVAGTSLVLFFEAPPTEEMVGAGVLPRLEEDDAV